MLLWYAVSIRFRNYLEDDLLSNCDSKHHPVVKICMSGNREDEDPDDIIVQDVQSLSKYVNIISFQQYWGICTTLHLWQS